MMPCGHPGCPYPTREDLEFSAMARRYESTRQRFLCLAGHSTYMPPPLDPIPDYIERQRQSERGRKGGLASQAKRRRARMAVAMVEAEDVA